MDYELLKSRLRQTRYIVADGSTAEVALVNEGRVFRLMNKSGPFPSQVIVDAAKALQNFVRLTGDTDREFTLQEIATVAGVPYSQAYNWLMEGVIVPSVRGRNGSGRGKDILFSWQDAYVAGLLGSLRRQGVGLDVLRKVSQIFVKSPKKKRATRKVATST